MPEGAILGPILFFLFTNNITNAVSFIEIVMYADDTSVFISNSSLHELFVTYNDAFDKICTWFTNNMSFLNFKNSLYCIQC